MLGVPSAALRELFYNPKCAQGCPCNVGCVQVACVKSNMVSPDVEKLTR